MGRKKTAAKKGTPDKGDEKAGAEDETDGQLAEEGKEGASYPIVGIGASAGGLEALKEFLDNLPGDTGMAFVVVTHQHPGHTSLLPELLAKETGMTVLEAQDGTRLEPDHVYVAPPGANLAVFNAVLERLEFAEHEALHLPIDYFFRSLADDQKERAICIVLSGTGTDGTVGLKAIKAESGMAMVQQPQSAKYAGMPSSAIATGLADYVLPPAEMPRQLLAYAQGPYLLGGAVAVEAPVVPSGPMQKIFLLLRGQTGHDFSAYKSKTLRRRIERRMNVHRIEDPNAYVRYLNENPHEINLLFKELLISVTNFFRDPEAWEALGPRLDDLLKGQPHEYTVRAWVPGCATGEEAFSLAIVLREAMERIGRHFDVQIFGTDLDAAAIETARVGQYPHGIAVDVSPERLNRYFVGDDSTYSISPEIREMVIFAPQNVIKDPPFTKLDVLSCRNLLIYLNAELQRKLLPIFHYALKPSGLLLLGASETIGAHTELFEPLDKHWKVFRRKESVGAGHPVLDLSAPAERARGPTAFEQPASADQGVRLSTMIERLLLEHYAPASVVADEQGNIVFIHGRTGAFLEPSQGEPRHNVLEMAREGLHHELAVALRECARREGTITREAIPLKGNGESVSVTLTATKLEEPEPLRGLLLLTFRRAVAPPAPEPAARSRRKGKRSGDGERVAQLERELQHMKEWHQTAQEELETSYEELQSTNEELQSTNEELETSKEEMQSLNEELTTVNAQLQAKVEELSQSNDDMQNLLNSTDVATIFLDNDLEIKRFTEQASQLVNLRGTDVGRPISELTSSLRREDLAADCREVLKTLVFKEAEVETKDGRFYLMRIMPYRTSENMIDGLVLTFVNIGPLRRARERGEVARAYFEGIVNTVREPLLVLDGDLRVVSANRSFYRLFRTTPKQTEGELIYKLGEGHWDISELRELLEDILPKNVAFEDYEVGVDVPKLGRRQLMLNARRLRVVQPEGSGDLILLALEDMTGT